MVSVLTGNINVIDMEDNNESLKSLKDDSLKPQLVGLIAITSKLQNLSSSIFSNLLTSIVVLATLPFFRYFYYFSLFANETISTIEIIIISISFFLTLASLRKLIQFRVERRKGMVIYDDVTDEIDWGKRRREFIYNRPEQARVVIRNFIKSIDLPFSDGIIGETVYFSLFILISITVVVISYVY